MNQAFRYDKVVRMVTLVTLCLFFLYGVVTTFFPILPFWIDEWLLIDNLKFKTPAQLWFGLERTQQFPRVYLEIIKYFSSAGDYSYTSLRLPSFLTHSCGLILLYKLSGRIYKVDHLSRFLWVMFYVSFSTSIHYFVQLKQYTMEMALSLVGIWQLLELIRLESAKPAKSTYILLCISFLFCPFFSYTYPIVIAPVYLLVAIRSIKARRVQKAIWLPLLMGLVATTVFYLLDVKQVLADPGMQDFWQDLLMKTFSLKKLFVNTYMMFTNLGAGDLFGNILGVIGVLAFAFCCYRTAKTILSSDDETDILVQYSCLLICIVIGLFVAGKLPLGSFRLNCFVVPAVGLMILYMLRRLRDYKVSKAPATGIFVLVYLAMIGNVYVTMAELMGDEHAKKVRIYNASDQAIKIARAKKLPVLVTSGIAFPFDDRWPGDWILKTHPRYKVYEPLQVIAIPNADSIEKYFHELPPHSEGLMFLDGEYFKEIRK